MTIFTRIALVSTLLFGPNFTFGEDPGTDAKARYQAAVKAAEEKFQKRIDAARQDFLKDVASARSLLAEPFAPSPKLISLNDLPVEVTGAKPVPLKEGREQTGRKRLVWAG